MGLDLQLWTAYDLGLSHYLVRDIIHLDREASFHAFNEEGNEEGLVLPEPQPLDHPAHLSVPDPSHPDGSRVIEHTLDHYDQPLTFVRPDAFKPLHGDGKHNELVYRFVEQLQGFIVILYWC